MKYVLLVVSIFIYNCSIAKADPRCIDALYVLSRNYYNTLPEFCEKDKAYYTLVDLPVKEVLSGLLAAAEDKLKLYKDREYSARVSRKSMDSVVQEYKDLQRQLQ